MMNGGEGLCLQGGVEAGGGTDDSGKGEEDGLLGEGRSGFELVLLFLADE